MNLQKVRYGIASLLTIFSLGLNSSLLMAQPSTENPDGVLSVRTENEDLLKLAQQQYKELKSQVDKISKMSEAALKTANPAPIGLAHVAALKLQRLADRLTLAGEPAGTDFSLRRATLRKELEKAIEIVRQANAAQISSQFPQLLAMSSKKQNELPKIQKLADQQMFEEAEAAFYKLFDDLEQYAVWYEDNKQQQVLQTFATSAKPVRDKMYALRQEKALADLKKLYDQGLDTKPIMDFLAIAKTAVTTKGTMELDGKMLTGPDMVSHVAELWQQTHLAALKQRAIAWSIFIVDRNQAVDFHRAELSYSIVDDKIILGIQKIIEADANRLNADEAYLVYPQYLKAVGLLIARSNPKLNLAQKLKPSLDLLKAKSPVLETYTPYETVTNDILRWRARVATAYAKTQQDKSTPLITSLEKFATHQPPEFGVVNTQTPNLDQARMFTGLSDTATSLQKRLPNTEVSVGPLYPEVTAKVIPNVTSMESTLSSYYQQRCYAQVAIPKTLPFQPLASLKAELLIKQGTFPMTLDSAIAIYSAEAGIYQSAGGTISSIAIEGLVSQFATMRDSSQSFIAAGPLPAESDQVSFNEQVILEAQIKPTWIQHQYFFENLP